MHWNLSRNGLVSQIYNLYLQQQSTCAFHCPSVSPSLSQGTNSIWRSQEWRTVAGDHSRVLSLLVYYFHNLRRLTIVSLDLDNFVIIINIWHSECHSVTVSQHSVNFSRLAVHYISLIFNIDDRPAQRPGEADHQYWSQTPPSWILQVVPASLPPCQQRPVNTARLSDVLYLAGKFNSS